MTKRSLLLVNTITFLLCCFLCLPLRAQIAERKTYLNDTIGESTNVMTLGEVDVYTKMGE